jgi:hypothetical protein
LLGEKQKKQYNRRMSEVRLSVVIHTKNSADTLVRTLNSIKFADDIVVIDMHSSDETVKLAGKFTKRIYFHDDVGYADPARNFALSKAINDWILVIDADEVVTAELKTIILNLIADPQAADVYYLPRKNFIFDAWIMRTGWWPDFQPRLFKKGSVSWQIGVHRLPDVQGKVVHLPAEEKYALVHYNYTGVGHFLEKLNSYTSLQAKERSAESAPAVFSVTELMEIFAGEFARRSMTMNGIEDGLHGVSLSMLQAMYEAIIYLKQWGEKGYQPITAGDFGLALQKMRQTWAYWWADYQVRHTGGLEQWYWRIRRKMRL